ncbi:hypothetical protein VP01_59g3 [Puccinia sorghi]|uniref:Uncharacterized protein n=1 Tax=Puccinia sorghi TaxID=27349 RepID=A0A0L6UHG7_9BASI|nr:hypothetical protein VP01_59g3 [Puccinia sorghi]
MLASVIDTFLNLTGLGQPKEQQQASHSILDFFTTLLYNADHFINTKKNQIALKLHKAFPDEPLYLHWTLLSMLLQEPNRCNGHAGSPSPISLSIAHRCLQTLLNQSANKSHPELEDPNNFWIVLKVLEMVAQSHPELDHSKIVGIGKLKFPDSLLQPSNTSDRLENGPSTNDATISKSTSLPSPSRAIECRRPELPEYISLAREDYFTIFDSSLGRMMRFKYLNLELMWRQRAVEWANPIGLRELIDRMNMRLEFEDHNWSTMITLNQAASNLLRVEKSAVNEYNLIDHFYLQLNHKQQTQKSCERGYALARVDLRCRLRDPSLSELKDNFHPLAGILFFSNLDQVVFSYFDQFGDKTCCFDDLAPYLKLLTPAEANQLGVALDSANRSETDQLCETFLRKQINLEKIRRSIALIPGDKQVAEAARLMRSYSKYIPLGNNLPTTTLQPADGMAILAAQALIENWQGPHGELKQAICSVANLYAATYILEGCLARSAQQYQARSLLIRLHRLLGNLPRNVALFYKFGIKHIQYDTLSHLGLDRCSIFFGHNSPPPAIEEDGQSQALRVLNLIEYPATFYEYIESDTSTWINNCYMSGNYIKVEDLSFFKHQINVSLQRKVLRIERIRLLLFEKIRLSLSNSKKIGSLRVRSDSDDESSSWDRDEVEMNLLEVLQDCQSTIDNRDFTVIPDCRPWSTLGTCHQTSLGPMLGVSFLFFGVVYLLELHNTNLMVMYSTARAVKNRWLWTMSTIYARVVTPHLKFVDHPSLSDPDFFSEVRAAMVFFVPSRLSKLVGALRVCLADRLFSQCTSFEIELFQYSKTLSNMLKSTQSNLLESHTQRLVEFFARRNDEVEALNKSSPADLSHSDMTAPPSQLLAIIHSAYEVSGRLGFCLFRFASMQFISSSSSPPKGNKLAKTLKATNTKIINKLKSLDVLIQTTLDEIDKQQDSPTTRGQTMCLFGSAQLGFPWREETGEEFGTEDHWRDSLLKIFHQQRATLVGWHSLIKLAINPTTL